ncbi:non-canonical purine NTP pyrophosphatase [Candidatus Nanosalina sp. VS9-1]|uniref:non-canonical purine NTP pyrophosphatase n=1 Tax=Candidatus Nanosalina sp. VS9-1 TaxID=3388566 RepID=UPI0039E08C9E
MEKVFFATSNEGKLAEMEPKFEERGLELVQVDVDVPEIDAMDVENVAEQKARDSLEASELEDELLIVEDTGFYVEAIGGFPGAEAAFFADTAGAEKLLDLMRGEENRKAYFKTAIAVIEDGEVKVFTGKMEGRVPEEKTGESHPHLPYNSYFIPEGEEESLAQDQNLKDGEFHRNRAVKKFLDWLEEEKEL